MGRKFYVNHWLKTVLISSGYQRFPHEQCYVCLHITLLHPLGWSLKAGFYLRLSIKKCEEMICSLQLCSHNTWSVLVEHCTGIARTLWVRIPFKAWVFFICSFYQLACYLSWLRTAAQQCSSVPIEITSQYRRGHECESRLGLNFFQAYSGPCGS